MWEQMKYFHLLLIFCITKCDFWNWTMLSTLVKYFVIPSKYQQHSSEIKKSAHLYGYAWLYCKIFTIVAKFNIFRSKKVLCFGIYEAFTVSSII